MPKIFISDYDGTITNKDIYSLLAERYVPPDTPDYFTQYLEGRITHFDAMAEYFAFMPNEERQLEELFDASEADPDLGASAALLTRAGWPLLSFQPALPGTSSVCSGGLASRRLFTRIRDVLRKGAGSCWTRRMSHLRTIRRPLA